MVVLNDSVLVSRVITVFFGSIGRDGTEDRRIGSNGGRRGDGGGAVSTGGPMEYSFNDGGYEALTIRDGDGIGWGTWGRAVCGGGLIIGLEGELGMRERSGRGGKGGLVGGEGRGFREPSFWDLCDPARFGRVSKYSKLSSFTLSLSFCRTVRASCGVRTMVTLGACSTRPKTSFSLGSDIRSGGEAAVYGALVDLFPDSQDIVPDNDDCLDLWDLTEACLL